MNEEMRKSGECSVTSEDDRKITVRPVNCELMSLMGTRQFSKQ